MAKKSKPTNRGAKRRPAARRPTSQGASARASGARGQPRAAEIPLQQGLQEMAAIGARSLLWLIAVVASFALLAGAGFAVWSLRPVPAYSSAGVEIGTPFDVTFRIENTSHWFPLAQFRISCLLRRADAPDMPPVAASDVTTPAGNGAQLGPDEQATFKCPFSAALRATANDELGIALRSELYFRITYDLPLIGSFRLADNRGPFVLNTKLLPPRWTAKSHDSR